ncbi:MAG TPA: SDR family NAD(P)-dependent oxidoreductase, partial [Magnetospirillaceae bacterium]
MDRFAGKTALVTGAGRNIGAVIAETLASQGAMVAVHYSTSVDQANAVVAKIEAAGGRAFGVRADISTVAGVDGLVETLRTQLQARRHALSDAQSHDGLDILVNNAAM